MALSSPSAAASVATGGSFMALLRAIERGTMLSMRARRDDSPITDSIIFSSASSMPMWRGMNSEAFSSSQSGRADCINMGNSVKSGTVVADSIRNPSAAVDPGSGPG
jgi:hypothetical protein